jgi:hypothetical protein
MVCYYTRSYLICMVRIFFSGLYVQSPFGQRHGRPSFFCHSCGLLLPYLRAVWLLVVPCCATPHLRQSRRAGLVFGSLPSAPRTDCGSHQFCGWCLVLDKAVAAIAAPSTKTRHTYGARIHHLNFGAGLVASMASHRWT